MREPLRQEVLSALYLRLESFPTPTKMTRRRFVRIVVLFVGEKVRQARSRIYVQILKYITHVRRFEQNRV